MIFIQMVTVLVILYIIYNNIHYKCVLKKMHEYKTIAFYYFKKNTLLLIFYQPFH